MTLYPVAADAAPAMKLPLPNGAFTATAVSSAARATPATPAAAGDKRIGMPPAAEYPAPETPHGWLATVTELYPGSRADKRSRRNRSAIRALKRSYLRRARLFASDAGMATAEYAIATLAAVGFAGILVFLLRSEEVRGFLLKLIQTALALP